MEEFLGRMRRVEVPIEDRILRRHFSDRRGRYRTRSEEHTSELQSLMRISYAVFCLKKKKKHTKEQLKESKIHRQNKKTHTRNILDSNQKNKHRHYDKQHLRHNTVQQHNTSTR